MTTGKTITLTRWTFVGKVMSLLLNILSRLVITFLPRSKHLLISWLQSPSAVILEQKERKKERKEGRKEGRKGGREGGRKEESLLLFPLFPHLFALK